jgi:hypothetical protein
VTTIAVHTVTKISTAYNATNGFRDGGLTAMNTASGNHLDCFSSMS